MYNEDDIAILISKGYYAISDIADQLADNLFLGEDIIDDVQYYKFVSRILYSLQRRSALEYDQVETLLNGLIKQANLY